MSLPDEIINTPVFWTYGGSNNLKNGIITILNTLMAAEDKKMFDLNFSNLLDDASMKNYWFPCFTHNSFTQTEQLLNYKNYDAYEFMGDKMLNDIFITYVQMKYPYKITQATGTWLTNQFMQRKWQAKISDRIGLFNLLKKANITFSADELVKVKGDIFESFFGTLVMLIDAKKGIMNGQKVAYGMLKNYLDVEQFNFDVQRDAASRLQEAFNKLFLGKVGYRTFSTPDDPNGLYRTIVLYSNSEMLSSAYGFDKDDSKRNAAEAALLELSNRGYTQETIDEISTRNVQQKESTIADLKEQANNVLLEWYTHEDLRPYLPTSLSTTRTEISESKNEIIVNIVGTYANAPPRILASGRGLRPVAEIEAWKQFLTQYKSSDVMEL